MRIELPRRHLRLGAVRIHEAVRVLEIDSGLEPDRHPPGDAERPVVQVRAEDLEAVTRRMAVVVPCKDEPRGVIEGVLSALPHHALVVLVSASARRPLDRYELELQTVEGFCRSTGRLALVVHQDDPGLGLALERSGLGEMVVPGENGVAVARRGKGEAMTVGAALAMVEGRETIGFVDADNYVPGAVHEYVRAFAALLHLASTPCAMVRISWPSKPKVSEGRLVFRRWGRSSQVVNRHLDSLLAAHASSSPRGAPIVVTGNSGEHAMTTTLARRLRLAGGFAVEPFELVDVLEQFGGLLPGEGLPARDEPEVEVFQVETRSPHFHQDRGEAHVAAMQAQGLELLSRSPLCPPGLRREIRRHVRPAQRRQPPPPVYPPLAGVDLDGFATTLEAKAPSFRRLGRSPGARADGTG